MELQEPDKSLVVLDKKTIWVVNYPAAEFKSAKLQVIKANVDSSKGRAQSFIGLLARGRLLKEFYVVGVHDDSKTTKTYFLQPRNASDDFKRAEVTINAENQIEKLLYWDNVDNETQMQFSKITLNKKVSDGMFRYSPPSDADVTVY